jgi:hypothetical protein
LGSPDGAHARRRAARLTAGISDDNGIALSSARAKFTSGFAAYPTFPTHSVPAGPDFFEADCQSFREIDTEPDGPSVVIDCAQRAHSAGTLVLDRFYTGASGRTPNCALFSMTIATNSAVMHCAEEANP